MQRMRSVPAHRRLRHTMLAPRSWLPGGSHKALRLKGFCASISGGILVGPRFGGPHRVLSHPSSQHSRLAWVSAARLDFSGIALLGSSDLVTSTELPRRTDLNRCSNAFRLFGDGRRVDSCGHFVNLVSSHYFSFKIAKETVALKNTHHHSCHNSLIRLESSRCNSCGDRIADPCGVTGR